MPVLINLCYLLTLQGLDKYVSKYQVISRGKSRVQDKFSYLLFSTQRVFCFQQKGSFVFKHLCQSCIVLNTDKWVMTSNDVRKECLECHMTSNVVKGECHITMMTGRCVNKPDQTEPVGCYENTFISKFAKCV